MSEEKGLNQSAPQTVRCPECKRKEAVVYTEEYAVCPHCKRLINLPLPAPTCKKCGSDDLQILSEEYGVCRHCKTLVMLLEDEVEEEASPQEEAPPHSLAEEAAPAPTDNGTALGLAAEIAIFGVATPDVEEDKEADEDKTVTAPQAITCPACGSGDVTLLSDELGACDHCQTRIVLPKASSQTVVHNEVHLHGTGDLTPEEREAIPVLALEDFPRVAFLRLAAKRSSPDDIFDAEFGVPTTVWRQLADVTADVTVAYSVKLGTKRTVTHEEWNSGLQKFVEKKETVIDWNATNGTHYENGLSSSAFMDSRSLFSAGSIESKFTPAAISSYEYIPAGSPNCRGPRPILPDQGTINECLRHCRSEAEKRAQNNIIADAVKDFSATSQTKITEIVALTLPEYRLPYTYAGAHYTVARYAHLEHWEAQVYDGVNPSATKDRRDAIYRRLCPLEWITTLALISSILLSIIGFFSFNGALLRPVLLTFLGSALAFITNRVWSGILGRQGRMMSLEKRIAGLKILLKKRGYAPLTLAEEEMIRKERR